MIEDLDFDHGNDLRFKIERALCWIACFAVFWFVADNIVVTDVGEFAPLFVVPIAMASAFGAWHLTRWSLITQRLGAEKSKHQAKLQKAYKRAEILGYIQDAESNGEPDRAERIRAANEKLLS